MSYYIECPHCGEDCGTPDDHADEGEENEWQCDKCKKYFMFTTSYSVEYDSSKAPCLNGGKHKWEKIIGAPREFFEGKYRCKYCNEEKTIEKDKMTQEINDYIKKTHGDTLSQSNIDRVKGAMLKYKDNRWWESKDIEELASYQLLEDILLIDFSTFHKGVEKLMGRSVYTLEFVWNFDVLKEKAKAFLSKL